MGLFDNLRHELVDIVEWIDDSNGHTLVWRFPRHQNQIKQGAKLIVRPGQQAIFVLKGQLADVFGPGTHVLKTGNLPILSNLAGWKHGFDSPWKSEIYFVSTRQLTGLKWGTPHPVPLRDADFGTIRLRAFGTYSLRAVDPRALLTELVGTDQNFEADEILELLRSVIVSTFADLLGTSEIAALDLAANYRELSQTLQQQVIERVDDEYGLDIPQLDIVNVSMPKEVEEALDARASMSAIGDLDAYRQYQLGTAIPDAAANPGGGAAGAGLGLGMGMAMAQPLMAGFAAPSPAAAAPPAPGAAAPAPPPAPPPVLWHVAEGGATSGPFTAAQLAERATQGLLRVDTSVWRAGLAAWTPAGQVPELAAWLAPPPPPAP